MEQRQPSAGAAAANPARRRRLDSIVSVATRLFHERGYESTSVNDLAAALELSVGGLYRYITTKSDVLVMVCENIYGDLVGRLDSLAGADAAPAHRLSTLLDAYLRSCVENRPLILLMYREYRHLPRPAQLRFQQREEAIAGLFEQVIAEGVAEGDFEAVDSWALAHNIVLAGHLPALKSWAFRSGRRNDDDFVGSEATLVFQTLGVRGRTGVFPSPRPTE